LADFPEHAADTRPVWDQLADWWDERIGDGNATQDLLVEPTQERLLALAPGERVLDIACGAGRFTRRMAAGGASIVAFDHSARFIERARRRTPPELTERIDYRVLDAGDEAALVGLGEAAFDAAVCTMALMDMARISPLLGALPRLLRPGGRFVFSVTHPVFNSGDARVAGEQRYAAGTWSTELSIKVVDYLTPRMEWGVGVPGQPVEQHYFHRPLGVLLNACFDSGLVLDRLEEPAFPPPDASVDSRALSWSNLTRVPQVLVVRLRPS
jgi:SAM-dependent methyltransferase